MAIPATYLPIRIADVAAQQPVPTLRSFLKLYTSLGSKKLPKFLDADEEEGQTITTSDLNFYIDEVKPFDFVNRHGSHGRIYSRQTICRVVHQGY